MQLPVSGCEVLYLPQAPGARPAILTPRGFYQLVDRLPGQAVDRAEKLGRLPGLTVDDPPQIGADPSREREELVGILVESPSDPHHLGFRRRGKTSRSMGARYVGLIPTILANFAMLMCFSSRSFRSILPNFITAPSFRRRGRHRQARRIIGKRNSGFLGGRANDSLFGKSKRPASRTGGFYSGGLGRSRRARGILTA